MIKTIPLSKLVQSPRNVRRIPMPLPMPNSRRASPRSACCRTSSSGPAKGKFEVEAGERRRKRDASLADDKVLPKDHEVTCLVLEDSAESAIETSLAENFHRLAMNPADEAQAFASLIDGGASVEDVARRFGLTIRFVEGRLRLATLAPASVRGARIWRDHARSGQGLWRHIGSGDPGAGSSSRSRRPTTRRTRTASAAWYSRARSGAAIPGPARRARRLSRRWWPDRAGAVRRR
jgi:ParB-like chromosome segregation protein Spo0J